MVMMVYSVIRDDGSTDVIFSSKSKALEFTKFTVGEGAKVENLHTFTTKVYTSKRKRYIVTNEVK